MAEVGLSLEVLEKHCERLRSQTESWHPRLVSLGQRTLNTLEKNIGQWQSSSRHSENTLQLCDALTELHADMQSLLLVAVNQIRASVRLAAVREHLPEQFPYEQASEVLRDVSLLLRTNQGTMALNENFDEDLSRRLQQLMAVFS